MPSDPKCTLCGGDIADSRCEVCGAPALPQAELRQKPHLYIVVTAVFGAVMLISGTLLLLPLAPLPYGLAITAFATSASLGGIVWVTGNWLRREPIWYKGPIFHAERPLAYHLVSACILAFCLGLFLVIASDVVRRFSP